MNDYYDDLKKKEEKNRKHEHCRIMIDVVCIRIKRCVFKFILFILTWAYVDYSFYFN